MDVICSKQHNFISKSIRLLFFLFNYQFLQLKVLHQVGLMLHVVFFFSSLYRFTPVELAFLAEYAKTMSPVAKALDVLQGETSVQMGWLVPTITLLGSKLHHLRVASKFCEPLIAALLIGLDKRFGEMLADPELIAAAILVPKFKTCWTSEENILKCGKCLTSQLPLNMCHFLAKYFRSISISLQY